MNRNPFVTVVTLVGALVTGAAAVWCLASPATFADRVEFPRHEHFVHDLGAFQLGLAVSLLLAPWWADGLATALAPSTGRGRPTGPAVPATMRRLHGEEERHARRVLRAKHPFLHGVAVPLTHRLGRAKTGRTVHFELRPGAPGDGGGERE